MTLDSFGNQGNVVMLCMQISFSALQEELSKNDEFVYNQNVQKILRNRYLSVISPQEHEKKLIHQRQYDKIRNLNPERKKIIAAAIKKQDQTPRRQKCMVT